MKQAFISIVLMSLVLTTKASSVGDSVLVFQVASKVVDLNEKTETSHAYFLYLTPDLVYQKDSIGNETIISDSHNLFIDHQEGLVIFNKSLSSLNHQLLYKKSLQRDTFCDTAQLANSFDAEHTLNIACYKRIYPAHKIEIPKIHHVIVHVQGEWVLQGRLRHYQIITFNH